MSTLAFLGSSELLIVAGIALVLFGGSQLPKLARNLGKAQRELQKGLAEGQAEDSSADRADGGSGDGTSS
ncbi:MAG: twin-arginine translocase TatA/TatE family subunit [Acidimicrobiaceae bacterium]|nr:twin-arginine translocase TatA/TatE family subunit [Acidimicrobiaceae bacterium]|tara:strand:- start:4 stop:213 length:210 start_codon:yes stop_codon:yes gene_type:complete